MRISRRKTQVPVALNLIKGQNKLIRARIETSGPSHAGRTAERRTNWVDSLHEKRSFSSRPGSNLGYSKISEVVAKKRLSVAKRLIVAKKIRSVLPSVSNLIQKRVGWKSKSKGAFLRRINKREEEEKNRVGQKPNN